MNKQKKFIVTGGCGFIGYHLVEQLLLHKQKVIIIDNLSNSKIRYNQDFYDNCSAYNSKDNILFYNADIRDKDFIDTIFKENQNIDVCIHLAAKISVNDSIKNPEDTMDINVNGTSNLLEASAKYGIKDFIFASSAAVYGNSNYLPLKETEKCNPISPYGMSKLKGEEMVVKYSKNIENTISLRFFNIYGIGQSYEYAGVITKFAKNLTNDKTIVIYGDGNQTRDFISIRDVIEAIIMSTSNHNYKLKPKSSNNSNNIFNVATGKPIKIIEIARIIIELLQEQKVLKNVLNKSTKIMYQEARKEDILHSYADIKKIEENIGFRPVEDIENGLRNYINKLIKDNLIDNL